MKLAKISECIHGLTYSPYFMSLSISKDLTSQLLKCLNFMDDEIMRGKEQISILKNIRLIILKNLANIFDYKRGLSRYGIY